MNKKALVTYFSCSGTTARVAKFLANYVQAEMFEIQPEVPYTEKDLDWHNKESRSSVEMHDETSRPAIEKKVPNMEEYEVVFVGFPIWWYVAPTIVHTFLESYDLTGKIIVPFCTSSGSDTSQKMNELLKASCAGADYKAAKCLNRVTRDMVARWLKSVGLE